MLREFHLQELAKQSQELNSYGMENKIKINKKEQAIILDALNLLSKEHDMTDDELLLASKLDDSCPKNDPERNERVVNNLRNKVKKYKTLVDLMIDVFPVEITEGTPGINYQCEIYDVESDFHEDKYDSLLLVLNQLYIAKKRAVTLDYYQELSDRILSSLFGGYDNINEDDSITVQNILKKYI